MLLDSLEEDFNLPSVTVKFRYCDGFQREVIRREPIDRPFLKVLIHNESEHVGIFSGGVVSSKSNGLVRDKASLRNHLPSLDDFVPHIVFRPRHKEGVVEMEGRPRAKSQAEIDGGTVEGIYHLIQINAKLLSLIKILCSQHQLFGKVLINTPILLLVRFCEGRPGHRLESRPIQILSAEVKCSLDISQSRTVGELREAHHQELVPAIELDRVTITAIAVDALLKLVFVDERHDLREDGFTLVHDLRMAA